MMYRTEVPLHAPAPAPHKRKIERAPDSRAGKRNQTAGPFFRSFRADLGGEAPHDARNQFFQNLFLSKIFSVVNPGGGGRGFPHFYPLIAPMRFKSVEQRKPLDQPQRDHRKNAGVRQKRDHSTQAESRPFGKSQPLGIANQLL